MWKSPWRRSFHKEFWKLSASCSGPTPGRSVGWGQCEVRVLGRERAPFKRGWSLEELGSSCEPSWWSFGTQQSWNLGPSDSPSRVRELARALAKAPPALWIPLLRLRAPLWGKASKNWDWNALCRTLLRRCPRLLCPTAADSLHLLHSPAKFREQKIAQARSNSVLCLDIALSTG